MEITEFIDKSDSKNREIVKNLIKLIKENRSNLVYAIKWNQIVFATNMDYHHWICSISLTKNYVGLNFHFGSYLTDPNNIMKIGSSKFLRQIQLRDVSEIDYKSIGDLVDQAIDKLDEFKQTWKQK